MITTNMARDHPVNQREREESSKNTNELFGAGYEFVQSALTVFSLHERRRNAQTTDTLAPVGSFVCLLSDGAGAGEGANEEDSAH
jgi:hypothetical protein